MKISIGFLVADEEGGCVGFTDFGSMLVNLGLIYPPWAWFTYLRHGVPASGMAY